jgi:hypothetical protein
MLYVLRVHATENPSVVNVLDKFPSLQSPSVPKYNNILYHKIEEVAKTAECFVVEFPLLDVGKQIFTTRIEVLGDAFNCLQNKKTTALTQPSPCVLAVNFGSFQVLCNYSFPVDGKDSKITLFQNGGSIKVAAPLVSPSHRGLFSSNPFPVLPSCHDSRVVNWFTPYINFRQLSELDRWLAYKKPENDHGDDIPESHRHLLLTMLVNQERIEPVLENAPRTKLHVMHLLVPRPPNTAVALSLESQHGKPDIHFVFFVHGLYLDLNSRSLLSKHIFYP